MTQLSQNGVFKPINYNHAQQQIELLESVKVSKGEKIANGIASILPTSIILNLITGEYVSRAKIASGKFDSDLHMKINVIHIDCNESKLSPMSKVMSKVMTKVVISDETSPRAH